MGVVLGIREDGDKKPLRVGDEGEVRVESTEGNPVFVTTPPSLPAETADGGIAQTGDVQCSKQPTNSATEYPLPEKDGEYILTAVGQAVYLRTGTGTVTAATATAGGFSQVVPEGATIRMRLAGDMLSFIGTVATTGALTIVHVKRG